MPVGVDKVEPAPAAARVDLAVRRCVRPTAVPNTLGLEAAKDLVELLVGDQKRVVVTLEGLAIVPVEAQVRIDVNLSEVAHGPAVRHAKNAGKEPGRAFLVLGRHDRVVERDRHSPIIPPGPTELNPD